jgi:hypothetical protein
MKRAFCADERPAMRVDKTLIFFSSVLCWKGSGIGSVQDPSANRTREASSYGETLKLGSL